MKGGLKMFSPTIYAMTEKDLNQIVKPLLEVLGVVVPVLLTVVGAVGAIWVIFLGVKFARAEEPQEHEKARSNLTHAIVGFVLIFVLLMALKIGLDVFANFYKNYDYPVI